MLRNITKEYDNKRGQDRLYNKNFVGQLHLSSVRSENQEQYKLQGKNRSFDVAIVIFKVMGANRVKI